MYPLSSNNVHIMSCQFFHLPIPKLIIHPLLTSSMTIFHIIPPFALTSSLWHSPKTIQIPTSPTLSTSFCRYFCIYPQQIQILSLFSPHHLRHHHHQITVISITLSAPLSMYPYIFCCLHIILPCNYFLT